MEVLIPLLKIDPIPGSLSFLRSFGNLEFQIPLFPSIVPTPTSFCQKGEKKRNDCPPLPLLMGTYLLTQVPTLLTYLLTLSTSQPPESTVTNSTPSIPSDVLPADPILSNLKHCFNEHKLSIEG